MFLCLHGAGHSALSFAMLALELKSEYRIVSFDFRGHGFFTSDIVGASKVEDTHDYSTETLISDTIRVMEYVAKKFENTTIVVVGHSMGGAIGTKATERVLANKLQYPWHTALKGVFVFYVALFVIDVVEGVALEALQYMDNIICSRPKSFKSMEAGIKWK